MGLKKLFEKFKADSERRLREATVRDINNTFNVAYRNGSLYILCGMRAIHKIDKNKTVSEIIQSIDEIKCSAKEFQL